MKRSIFLLLTMGLLFSACMKDTVKEHYTFYRPVYHTRDEVRNNIKSSTPVSIQSPGKIVIKDNFLFLNEIDKGIHVINIANPAKPVNTAFIEIPGCVDIAINGVNLYADCYTDLVTLDISNPANVSVKQFLGGVFPHRYYSAFRADTTKVIAQWIKVDTVVEKRFEGTFARENNLLMMSTSFMSQSSFGAIASAMSSSGIGIAGSLARFALQNNRMYTVSNNDLKVFNVTTAAAPSFVSTIALTQGNIETIFPYKNKLFIGGQLGMYIYNASNPDNPQKEGQFTHARNCDPVIADDKYAYVTLSTGSTCRGTQNQLDVVDITSLSNPILVKSYGLNSPRGLSKDGTTLLICDGKGGLKIFNAADPSQVTLIKQVSGFEPNDVIALQGIAITVANDGLYFIDYSNPANASVISKMQIVKN